jgi:hypothetical protein
VSACVNVISGNRTILHGKEKPKTSQEPSREDQSGFREGVARAQLSAGRWCFVDECPLLCVSLQVAALAFLVLHGYLPRRLIWPVIRR